MTPARFGVLVRGVDGLFLDAPGRVVLARDGTPELAWAREVHGDAVVPYRVDPGLGAYPATLDLLRHSDLAARLRDHAVPALLLTVRTTPALAAWAAEAGLRLLSSEPALQARLEQKLTFDGLVRAWGLPVPDGGEWQVGDPWPLSGPGVLQLPESMGGEGTFFVESPAAVDALVRDGRVARGEPLLLRRRVGGRPLGVTILVTRGRVALSPPRLQCYHPPGDGPGMRFAGVQWIPPATLPLPLRARLDTTLLELGRRLHGLGFRGFANVDMIVGDDDAVHLIECNPRWSAATPQLLLHPELLGVPDVGRAWLDAVTEADADVVAAAPGAPDPVGASMPDTGFAGATLDVIEEGLGLAAGVTNGAWSRDGRFLGPRLDAGAPVRLVRLAHPGEVAEPGCALATLLAESPLYDADGGLLPDAERLLAALRGPRLVADPFAARARLAALVSDPPTAVPADLTAVADAILLRRDALLRHAAATPCYVYDGDGFAAALDAFRAAFDPVIPGHRAHYAVKANPHPLLLAEAARRGYGLDVASARELTAALAHPGVPVVFGGPAKSEADLAQAVAHADRVVVNLDSFGELARLGRVAAAARTPIRAGVRLATAHHGAWAKFGIPVESLRAFVEAARAWPFVRLEGLHVHLSWNRDPEPYVRVVEALGRAVATLDPADRAALRFVDLGGGFRPHGLEGAWPADHPLAAAFQAADDHAGVATRLVAPPLAKPSVPLSAYASAIGAAFRTHLAPWTAAAAWTEPGRVVATPAMHLLVRVVDKKRDDLVIVDGGIHMVGWERFLAIYHPVVNLTRPARTEIEVRIGGSLCDCEDVLGLRCFASGIEDGDVLVIPFQGAYSFTTAQDFIRPIPPVVAL